VSAVDDLARALERERRRGSDAEAQVAQLEQRLYETETRLARLGELELELRDLGVTHRQALDRHHEELAELNAQLNQALARADWRNRAPIRWLKHR
jgi:chromosome segregation ATPase